jgi:hypothetical protein
MSLTPLAIQPVPAETVRVARAAFPKGNPYLTLRDTLGPIFQDDDFAPSLGLPLPGVLAARASRDRWIRSQGAATS